MKKFFLCFLLSGVLLGGVFQQAQAQDKTLEFNLNAGAILNFKLKNFFVGGGIILPFFISGEEEIEVGKRDKEPGDLMPKINAGLRIHRIKLTLYLIPSFDDFFGQILIGANIGIVF